MESGPSRAPALPGVPICHDGLCGFLLGSQAQCGELREVTWFVVVSFLGALPGGAPRGAELP